MFCDIYNFVPWHSALTEHNGQHLSSLFLSGVHTPESLIGVQVRHWPKGCVCPSVWQILHLAAHPDRRMFHLVDILCILLPSLLLQIQLCAAARGMADAAVVLRVHWGQHWVLHWSCLWAFAPQATWEQIGFGWTCCFHTLLKGQVIKYQYKYSMQGPTRECF